MPDDRKEKDFERGALLKILSETEKLANVGGWEWDIIKNVWTFSDNWLRIHGCSKRHLVTAELLSIAHPDDRQNIQNAFASAVTEGTNYEIEHCIIRQDNGEERYVSACGIAELDSEGKAVKMYGSVQDITKLRLTEKLLRESESKYRNFVNMAQEGIWVIDEESKTQFVNESMAQMLGYTENEMVGKPLFKFMDERGVTLAEQNIDRRKKGIKEQHDFEFIKKDGSRIYTTMETAPINDEAGNFKGAIAGIIEITDKKRTEEYLQKQNRYFAKLQELGNIGTWQLDLINNALVWTDENCRIFGVPEGSVVDYETFIDKVHPDDREYVDREWKAGVKGKPYDIEHRLLLDGVVKWVREKADIDFDDSGKAVSAIGFTQDVTARKHADEALKESEELFRVLFDNAPLPYQSLDKGGNFIEVNKKWLDLLGYSREEIIGKSFADFLHPEWADHFKEKFPRFKSIGEILGIEFEFRKKDGSFIWIQFDGKIRRDGEGNFIQTHCVFRDITEQRRLEKKIIEQERALRHAQKMESVGTLAGGIAHEFNNILSIIIGNNELVMDELPEWSLARESTEEIRVAGMRARDVVRQLLTFSRQDNAEKSVLNIRSIVHDSIKLIRSSIPTNIEILENLSDDVSPVLGNATQINQLLINLSNNAVDAMPGSGGLLAIDLSNETVDGKHDVSLAAGQYVKLTVCDNGIGMGKETLHNIFDPYFTTKEIGKGTGIGLSVVHSIVERHNGAIRADSRPGQGTTFTIYFPIHDAIIEDENHELTVLPIGDERVLYVDDEPSIAKLGKRHLERLGYTVESTTDSSQALEMIKTNPEKFDLVISDMAMPKMTGDQLIAEVLKVRPDMPTIICTGYSAKISEKEAAEIGVTSFVMKPLAKAELAETVRKVLDATKPSFMARKR